MDLKVTQIPKSETETLEIRCHKVSDEVREIVSFIKSRQGMISGKIDGNICEIPILDIYYFESVDNRSFAYTASDNYEINMRIYELEELLRHGSFVRIQKGMLVNLLKIKSIKPGLSGRYVALLKNKEEVIISRNYVPALKKTLKGGSI
ncbi:MAG: LytTR family DNA-binding domain-containing protein [Lachnospiraceae bacterium]